MAKRLSPLKFFDFFAVSFFALLFIFFPVAKKANQPDVKSATTSLLLIPQPKDDLAPVAAISAQAVYVYDPDSGTTIYEKNSQTIVFPASTTKLMTALVALGYYDLDDVLTVDSAVGALGQSIHLAKGDRLTVENILYGLLVGSGNDAAVVLAENYPGGYTQFIAKMNQKARELGLVKTNFTNVTGLPNPNHVTTAKDLTIIGNEAIKNAVIRKIVATRSITISDVTGEKKFFLESTNKLLGLEGVKGLKTGWTPESGECLITLVTRDGKSIVVTLLNSTDRFGESAKIINWVYDNFTWEKI